MQQRRKIFWLLTLIALLVLAGCRSSEEKTSSEVVSSDVEVANLPDYILDAPPTVREAYMYAMQHPEEVAKYPCYCGCGNMGHTSNLSCYIQDINADGTVVWDNHAAGCGICVDITRDVMRLKAEGKPSLEIRQYVDALYSAFGPATDTAMPLE